MAELMQPGEIDIPAEWPRTPEGYCSCPYCTAIREGKITIPKTQSLWAQRMGRPEAVR